MTAVGERAPLNIAIVGCGLIGHKRAQALGPHRLVTCVDALAAKAEHLAAGYPGCRASRDLGSSGSFTTALLKALHTHANHIVHARELAEQACYIEIDRLGEQIGGFLMVYAEDMARRKRVLSGQGLREVRFRFDFEGRRVVV